MKSGNESIQSPLAPWPLTTDKTNRCLDTDVNHLFTVAAKSKQTIDRLDAVPENNIISVPVRSRMQRPRSIQPDFAQWDWFPQLEKGFMLNLQNGYIGDNVVFDRDRYYSLGRWWLGRSWELYANTTTVRQVPCAISVAAWGGEAFQHFVMDAIPKLASVIDFLNTPEFEHVKIVTHYHNSPAAKWFWDKLGIGHRIVQKPINAREGVVIATATALYVDFEPNLGAFGLYPRNILRPVQERLGILGDQPLQDLVVYLARTGKRSVANEDTLLTRIKRVLAGGKYGFHVFEASGDLSRDMGIIRRAKVVIGPHGGAFANLVFAKPGTHVVEFLPLYELYRQGQESRPNYWGLSQAAGLDYWTVSPRNFDFDQPGMTVDVDEVARILEQFV